MSKIAIICLNLFLIVVLAGCSSNISETNAQKNTSKISDETDNIKNNHINLPFEISDINNIEVFHYVVPTDTYKKVITKNEDIKKIYDVFESLYLEDKKSEPVVGSLNLQFKFNLNDDSVFAANYISAVGMARIRTIKQSKDYLTSADLDFCWFDDELNYEITNASKEELVWGVY